MSASLQVQVAIVGAGPSGLAAALALKAAGIADVVVLEREREAGGVPRHCAHPPYGLGEFRRLMTGPTYARRLRELAKARGVDIRLRHSVVALESGGALRVATPEGPLEIQSQRVILATGAREASRAALRVTGDRPLGVLNTGALQAYVYLKGLKPFARPLIVGTELVSLSAVWTCLRHGIRPVAVVERDPRGKARWPLTLFPKLFGVPVHYGHDVADICGAPRVEAVKIADAAGRQQTIACDGVLFTGEFTPEAALLRASVVEVDDRSGGPVVDQDGRCSDPHYFAAGNLLRPIENAGWCFFEGRRIGETVARDLAVSDSRPNLFETTSVRCGEGVRLVVPQRIRRMASERSPAPLQLRLSEPKRGLLTVRADGERIWSRRIASRPERRLLIPMSVFVSQSAAREFMVAVE